MGGRGSKGHRSRLSLSRELPIEQAPQEPTRSAPAVDAPIEEWDRHIQCAYEQIVRTTGSEWVRLTDLRKQLGDIPKAAQDTILKALRQANPDVHFAPDSNRKVLTAQDHDSAHLIGGEPNHLVSIERYDEQGRKLSWRNTEVTP